MQHPLLQLHQGTTSIVLLYVFFASGLRNGVLRFVEHLFWLIVIVAQ
jgi:hypothetical protein